jgi:uncharacterized protein YndB with AHSA1/START domain
MYGTLNELDGGRWQLRFTRTLPHPIEKVWQAVTEPEHLANWFPTTIEGAREAGAALRFTLPEGQGPPFDGEMLAFRPPTLMEFRWGTDIVRLELQPSDTGTVLTLLDTLDDRGKGARDGAGWHACLDALERELQGDPAARDAMNRWSEVATHYIESFGPEAATIGPPEGMS